MSDNGQILQTFERYGGDELRIGINSYNGGDPYLDCRIWFVPEGSETETYKPTKKGITIRASEIPRVLEALEKARVELAETAEEQAA